MAWSLRGFTIPGLMTEADMSDNKFRIMAYDGNMMVVRCGAGGTNAIGVLQDNPDGTPQVHGADVMSQGVSKIVAGATLTDGMFVTSDAEGRAVLATGSTIVIGRVLDGVVNAGELATVAINCVFAPPLFTTVGTAQLDDDILSANVAGRGKIEDGFFNLATVDDKFEDNSILETKLPDPAVDGLNALRVARITFDATGDASLRTETTHELGVTIPADALIVGGFIDVTDAFTDAAGASFTSVQVEAAEDILADAAVGALTLGQHDIIPDMTASEIVATTVPREVAVRVVDAPLTAGTMVIFLYYVVTG